MDIEVGNTFEEYYFSEKIPCPYTREKAKTDNAYETKRTTPNVKDPFLGFKPRPKVDMQQTTKKFKTKVQQQQLSGHQKVSDRRDHSVKNNTSPPPESTDTRKTADSSSAKSTPTTPKNQDNPLQQSYPALPETIFRNNELTKITKTRKTTTST